MERPGKVKEKQLDAWLLTWEGTAGPAADPAKKVIAIISARRSESFIDGLVEILYSRCVDSAYEMAFMANKHALRQSQYRHLNTYPSRILYGRRPCIYARRVTGLKIRLDEASKEEHLSWTEPAIYGNANSGSGIAELVKASTHSLVRPYTTISFDMDASDA